MPIRPKTSQRLTILLVICVIVGAAVYVGYRIAVHNHRLVMEQKRQSGMTAYANKDWKDAIDELGIYIADQDNLSEKGPKYDEALYALAQATDTSAHNLNDINSAIDLWQKYLSRQPDQAGNIKIEHQLLKREVQAERLDEALELAHELLAQNPRDQEAMEMLALSNFQSGHAEAARDMAIEYNKLNPTDDAGWDLTFRIERQLSAPLKRMFELTDAAEAKSSDPRVKLAEVMAFWYGFNPEMEGSHGAELMAKEKGLLLQLTAPAVQPPDASFAEYAVALLDKFGLYANSEGFLRRANAKLNSPYIRRLFIERLWQNGENQQVVNELSDITPDSTDPNPTLLAYKAMALHALKRDAEADALVSTLADASDNDVASAWALALQVNFHPDAADPGKQFTGYQQALLRDPANGVIDMMLAQSYFDAQEDDLAMEEAEDASKALPSWAAPHLLMAEALSYASRPPLQLPMGAMQAQSAVEAMAPDDPSSETALVVLYAWQYRLAVYHHDQPAIQDLIATLSSFRKTHADDPIVESTYVKALISVGDDQQARDVIQKAIANPPPLHVVGLSERGGEMLMIELAEVSHEASLGLENQILAAARKKFGLTRIAEAIAQEAVQTGKQTLPQALAFLQKASASGAGDPWYWQFVIADFREERGDPQARDAWIALGNAYPKNMAVQEAILNADVAGSLWQRGHIAGAFLHTTIDRLHALTGDGALGWRLATARLLLTSERPPEALQASSLLNDVLKHQFAALLDAQPHLLQSRAMEILGNLSGAITEMKRAADMTPSDPDVLYRLVYLYHKAHRYSDARDAFDRLASLTAAVPEPIAESSATIMFAQSEYQRAADMLSHYVDLPDAPDSAIGILAMCYQQLGDSTDAGRLFLRLKNATDLSPQTIQAAAGFFAGYNQIDMARQFLAKLDNGSLPSSSEQSLRADFEERFGDPAKADAIYRQAIAADKDDPQPAANYIGYLIRQKRFPQAARLIAAAQKSWPSNNQFPALKSLAAAMQSSYADRLAPVLDEMSRTAFNPSMATTLALMARTQAMSDQEAVQEFTDAINQPANQNYYPLYELAVGRMLMSDDPNVHSIATDLGQQAMNRFDSAAAFKLAANAYASIRDWNKALAASVQWRQRDAYNPIQADFYIARFQVNLGDPAAAATTLEPYVSVAQKTPQQWPNTDIIRLYAQTLLLTGQVDEADKLLRPLALQSAQWRDIWLALARESFTDGDAAAGWIDRVSPLLSSSDADKLVLASAWFNVANQYSYTPAFQNCVDILKPMAQRKALDQSMLLTLATAESSLNDSDAAAEYQSVIDSSDNTSAFNTATAQNNLANILMAEGDPASLAKAESLARSATQCTDPAAADTIAYFFDTLGHVELKEGKINDSIRQFQHANEILPNDPLIMIGLADSLVHGGKLPRARAMLSALQQQLDAATRLSPSYQQELDSVKAALAPASRPSVTNADFDRP